MIKVRIRRPNGPFTWDTNIKGETFILRKGYEFIKMNLIFRINKKIEVHFRLIDIFCLANKLK